LFGRLPGYWRGDRETTCCERRVGRADLRELGGKAAETARTAEAHGQPVIAIQADSADPKAVVDAVAQTIARFGHLEILVVNAGILIHGTVDKYDLADFDRMVATEDVN
jgi:NAD(P)-dependent dehydrogenase (short-subunit alcohol dehydrogenase family)